MFHIARAYNGLAEINCPAKFAGTHQTSVKKLQIGTKYFDVAEATPT